MLSWAALLASAAPPLELIGLEPTPAGGGARCEITVQDHDALAPFVFRLELTSPDPSDRSFVERVALGLSDPGVPTTSPVRALHEVDVRRPFVDERVADAQGRTHVTYVRPRSIDWGTWPLTIAFIGPRVDEPTALGAYEVTTLRDAAKADWGSCILRLTGPGVSSCVIVSDAAGGCLARYVETHRLGPAGVDGEPERGTREGTGSPARP